MGSQHVKCMECGKKYEIPCYDAQFHEHNRWELTGGDPMMMQEEPTHIDIYEEYLLNGVLPRNLEPCPNLIKSRAGDEVYYFCDLNDHPCDFEYHGNKCEEYEDFLRDLDNESIK